MSIAPISAKVSTNAISFKGNQKSDEPKQSFIKEYKTPIAIAAAALSIATVGILASKGKFNSPSLDAKKLKAVNADVSKVFNTEAPKMHTFATETEESALKLYDEVMTLFNNEKIVAGGADVEINSKLYNKIVDVDGTEYIFEKLKDAEDGASFIRKFSKNIEGILTVSESAQGDKLGSVTSFEQKNNNGTIVGEFISKIFNRKEAGYTDVVTKQDGEFVVAKNIINGIGTDKSVLFKNAKDVAASFDKSGQVSQYSFYKNSNNYFIGFEDGKTQYVGIRNEYSDTLTEYVLNELGKLEKVPQGLL